MIDGFAVGGLSGIAQTVGSGVDELGGMSAPDVPDAGASSAAVAGVLGSMSSVISNVVRTAATAQRKVADNQQFYQDVESRLRSAFSRDGEGTR